MINPWLIFIGRQLSRAALAAFSKGDGHRERGKSHCGVLKSKCHSGQVWGWLKRMCFAAKVQREAPSTSSRTKRSSTPDPVLCLSLVRPVHLKLKKGAIQLSLEHAKPLPAGENEVTPPSVPFVWRCHQHTPPDSPV